MNLRCFEFIVFVLVSLLAATVAASEPVSEFNELIDSYSKSRQFADFLSEHIDQKVTLSVEAIQPYWTGPDSGGLTLRMYDILDSDMEQLDRYAIAYAEGEQYCVLDCYGNCESTKQSEYFIFELNDNKIKLSGQFVPQGDLGHGHQGYYTVGLHPVDMGCEQLDLH